MPMTTEAASRGNNCPWPVSPRWCVRLRRNPDGSLWIAGEPGGLRQLNPRTHSKSARYQEANGLPVGGGVRSVLVDRHGLVWVSANTGLFRSVAPITFGGKAAFEQQFPPGTRGDEKFLKAIQEDAWKVKYGPPVIWVSHACRRACGPGSPETTVFAPWDSVRATCRGCGGGGGPSGSATGMRTESPA